MLALLEIEHICKALIKSFFADLQGPICYKDPQDKGVNLKVYET